MVKKLLFFILVVPGCMPRIGAVFNVAPELLPYYNKFINEAMKQRVTIAQDNFVMRFMTQVDAAASGSSIIGYCQTSSQLASIRINRSEWDQINEWEKIELTFHEMGHCLLGREHRLGEITINGVYIPVSIMNPDFFDGWFISEYYEYYMEELFHE